MFAIVFSPSEKGGVFVYTPPCDRFICFIYLRPVSVRLYRSNSVYLPELLLRSESVFLPCPAVTPWIPRPRLFLCRLRTQGKTGWLFPTIITQISPSTGSSWWKQITYFFLPDCFRRRPLQFFFSFCLMSFPHSLHVRYHISFQACFRKMSLSHFLKLLLRRW